MLHLRPFRFTEPFRGVPEAVVRVVEREKGLLWDKTVNERYMVVIDGREGVLYDEIVVPPAGVDGFFDSTNQLHYIAGKGEEFYLVEEGLT